MTAKKHARGVVLYERDILSFVVNPIRVLRFTHPDSDTVLVKFSMLNNADVEIGTVEKTYGVVRSDYLDVRFLLSVRRLHGRWSIVKRLYGRTRKGWQSRPFVEVAEPLLRTDEDVREALAHIPARRVSSKTMTRRQEVLTAALENEQEREIAAKQIARKLMGGSRKAVLR